MANFYNDNYEYKNFIWKDLALQIINSGGDNRPVDELAAVLESDFESRHSEEAFLAAEKWLNGLDNQVAKVSVEIPDDSKATLVLSILGGNLMTVLCTELDIEGERLTIEQQKNAVLSIREYTKILIWLGSNLDQLEKEVPNVK